MSAPDPVVLHVAVPRGCNTQQTGPAAATPDATGTQQPTLKALALRVLERNTSRNTGAMTHGKPSNKPCNTEGTIIVQEDERRYCSNCRNCCRGRCQITGFQVIDFLPRRCDDFRSREGQ